MAFMRRPGESPVIREFVPKPAPLSAAEGRDYLEALASAVDYHGMLLEDERYPGAARALLERNKGVRPVPAGSYGLSFGSAYQRIFGAEPSVRTLMAGPGTVVIGLYPHVLGFMLHAGDHIHPFDPGAAAPVVDQLNRHLEALLKPLGPFRDRAVMLATYDSGQRESSLLSIERLLAERPPPGFEGYRHVARQNRRLRFRSPDRPGPISLPNANLAEAVQTAPDGRLLARYLLPLLFPRGTRSGYRG